jgi:hypothetical protein
VLSSVLHSTLFVLNVPFHVLRNTPCIGSTFPRFTQHILYWKYLSTFYIARLVLQMCFSIHVLHGTPCIGSMSPHVLQSTFCKIFSYLSNGFTFDYTVIDISQASRGYKRGDLLSIMQGSYVDLDLALTLQRTLCQL